MSQNQYKKMGGKVVKDLAPHFLGAFLQRVD